jgi:N-acetyl-anhydromuramyl-L-alanine amidase AmpD
MADAREQPFNGGVAPMTEKQWDLLARVAAELSRRYKIPVTSKTILGHGEVQTELKIEQDQKWDPMKLPWDPDVSKQEVGRRFRARVRGYLG